MSTTAVAPEMDELKERLKQTWTAGNYDPGPTHKAFASPDRGAAQDLQEELETLWSAHNRAGNELTFVTAEYLEVIAVRA